MTLYIYLVAGWLVVVGMGGIVLSHNLVHTIASLTVAQSGTYVLLLGVGYQRGATAPVYGSTTPPSHLTPSVDPVVQAMTLTDIVVAASVTALLLAMTIQVAKRHRTVDPDKLSDLRG